MERSTAANCWNDNNLVFSNAVGNHIEPGNLLRRSFLPLLARAGLPRIRFHDLRHSAATLMMELGTSPKVVSEILGHSTVSITLDLYSHVNEEMQRMAAQSIDQALSHEPHGS